MDNPGPPYRLRDTLRGVHPIEGQNRYATQKQPENQAKNRGGTLGTRADPDAPGNPERPNPVDEMVHTRKYTHGVSHPNQR